MSLLRNTYCMHEKRSNKLKVFFYDTSGAIIKIIIYSTYSTTCQHYKKKRGTTTTTKQLLTLNTKQPPAQ